jgi:hypothetical protein
MPTIPKGRLVEVMDGTAGWLVLGVGLGLRFVFSPETEEQEVMESVINNRKIAKTRLAFASDIRSIFQSAPAAGRLEEKNMRYPPVFERYSGN